ncbi:amylo-alpha-1,6-glucosidase [Gloeocapsopsis dulcis]|uniref:Amylo-alpha-1,6-glucosidase n=1 Tax=Gloeocapsopsis dulcis AAB1 = 1H9 TaxID=1433147 RepID=A0A6N8FPL7_9CHRO|nr:amylo-alpha-1,6-glucosidase [Gloeocapsopsis dulcis]MUL35081.1 amylo-alpha-1,6-glucosidase [Gloeocapsopsis dulcis AAB1 = 1H9]WNN89838.1 amylo-alpha-1,6-glucosidase [Gloeocapsopsis dulcis]
MKNLDDREWLLTNGLGSFASGTVADARTRTYHGWLIAALDPPSQRTLLLSHIEASLEVANKVVALGTNYWGNDVIEPEGFQLLNSFEIEPVPTWVWQKDNWQLTRQIIMPHAERGNAVPQDNTSRVLIQYCYTGEVQGILRLRFMIADRDFHHQQQADPNLHFSQIVELQQIILQALRPGWIGTPWQLRWTQGEYQYDPVWYWNYRLPEETNRGLGDREDLFSPGYLTIDLEAGSCITLEAQVGASSALPALHNSEFSDAVQAEQNRLVQVFNFELDKNSSTQLQQQLLRASDQFIVHRASIAGPTVIAGYHWFNDWGRDTLIALPGLGLTTQRFDLAKGLLQTFGRYCRNGLIPNTFPDSGAEPSYNSIDAALLWIETLGLYLEATQDWDFLVEEYPIVQQIYKAFITGTKFNIQVDATDGLVSWDAPHIALTWMDAVIGGQPVTPRRGKPVEINALWYSALCWASTWAERLSQEEASESRLMNQARRYQQQAQKVKDSMQKFWNPTKSYLYDTIEPDDRLNSQIRPNAVLALSYQHSAFPTHQGRQILEVARQKLLTPYGLRSLAPEDLQYIGQCTGDVQHRDRAYHQGTVWTWLIGAFIRAWQRCHSEPVPCDWQPLLEHLHAQACIGSISEIFDGDAPHIPRGAIAQAWSVAEVLRHISSTAVSY